MQAHPTNVQSEQQWELEDWAYGRSLYFLLSFSINLKVLSESINYKHIKMKPPKELSCPEVTTSSARISNFYIPST